MNRWKVAFFACLGLLVLVLIIGAYLILDQSVTIAYMSDGFSHLDHSCNSLSRLYPKGGDQKDVLVYIRKTFPDGFIDEEGDTIQFDGLTFVFDKNRRLERIGF